MKRKNGLNLFKFRCNKLIDEVALKYFPMINDETLMRPIYFTSYLNKDYVSVEP